MKKQIDSAVFHASLTQAGLNAAQLAKKLGVSREAVSKWQRGEAFPKPDKLIRLGMILKQPYQALVQEAMMANEPQVAYRAKANRKTKLEHVVWAKEAGTRLRSLVPYLPFDRTCPPVLKAPKADYEYVQAVCAEVRGQMGVSENEEIKIQHFLDQFRKLEAVLIPVFWGEQKQHGQALHAYLPDSMTTWVWLDLDTKLHDFKFMMAHELGHAYSPSLTSDDAEDFADLFAQCLLCPHEVTVKIYRALSQALTLDERWDSVVNAARRRLISPYTVMKAMDAYAGHAGVSKINFGNFGPGLTRFNKSVKTVAELLFDGKTPKPAEYIQICSKELGTPFFDSLQSMTKKEGISPPFLVKTMDLSLMDAKAICQELA
jgi:transcriptional regulator with XRE-family HTH domain/Zn-dependent peptidase ImmA (M78 family)